MHVRHRLEYVALKAGLGLFRILPVSAGIRLGSGLGAAWHALDWRRRTTARDNIAACKIAEGKAARRIAKASFVHFGAMIAEALLNNMNTRARLHVVSDIHPDTKALLEKSGQGVILVSGHLGNWEIAAQHLGTIKPVVGVAKAMKNPWTDRLIKTLKTNENFHLIPMRSADAGRFFKALKSGSILALLADQHAKSDKLMVDFFGMPASAHPSPALLHLVTRIPVCFGVCLREGPMRYRFSAGPPWVHTPTGNRDADVRAVLARINRELEQAIRKYPEQYLWAHRRWRHMAMRMTTEERLTVLAGK